MPDTPKIPATPTDASTGPNPDVVNNSTDAIDRQVKSLQAQGYAVSKNSNFMAELDERMDQSRNVLSMLTNDLGKGTAAFGELSNYISDTIGNLSKVADLSQASMAKFGFVATAALGSTKSSFGSMNFDSLNLFSSQLDSLIDPIKNDVGALGMLANSMGAIIPKSIKDNAPLIGRFIRDMATSSDNAIKLEDTYVRAAAATGRLGSVHDLAGQGLVSMNKYVDDQRSALNKTIIATNLSKDTVEAYYNQLSNLPTAYKAGATEEEKARGNTDQLVNTIQLARGMGREYADVLGDMREAIRNYNASLPEAMKFTEEISEISGKYNVELKDVQNSLKGASEAFKMFGNEGEGAASILNEYVGSLKATGLSGAVATDIVGNMTSQISKLGIAQKAFLSAQQGGPGGLMGAFNIDMKLRQGKLDEVFNMAKNQLTKMMGGTLVSTEEAANSPAAAAQMTKQMQMLKQGPLGQFARTDAEAERIIDAFKGGKPVDFKELSKGQSGVEGAISKGNDYAAQTATGISRANAILEEIKGLASGANRNTLQSGLTAGAGFTPETGNPYDVIAARSSLKGAMASGARGVSEPANVKGSIQDAMDFVKDIPTYIKSAISGIAKLSGGEGQDKREAVYKEFAAKANQEKEQAMAIKSEYARNAELNRISKEDNAVKTALAAQSARAINAAGEPGKIPEFLKPQIGNVVSSGKEVGNAATSNANKGALTTTQTATHGHTPNAQPGILGNMAVTVNIHCPQCGKKLDSQSHLAAVSAGTTVNESNDHH